MASSSSSTIRCSSKLLEAHRGAERFVLWIKIDTGMNRLGFRPEDFPGALARLRALAVPALELRVMTHLARADERDESMTSEQVAVFERDAWRRGPDGPQRLATSIGNSAGTLGWPAAHGDWVRPGLAIYGVSPFSDETATQHGLRPAMTLETTVLTVRDVKRGETVGYAGAWRAERESTIAILAAGYGDGLPRHLQWHAGADWRSALSARGPGFDGHDCRGRHRRTESCNRKSVRSSGARVFLWKRSPPMRTPSHTSCCAA